MSSASRHSPITALLRHAWQDARRRMLADLRASGFAELDEAHLLVFQHPGPDGLRPSDLARRLHASRQATNYLLVQLESMGYLTRRRDAAGIRPRIHLTTRGRRLRTAMKVSLRRFEQRCRRRVGAERYQTCRDVLESMTRA